jgi:hypothetical protein
MPPIQTTSTCKNAWIGVGKTLTVRSKYLGACLRVGMSWVTSCSCRKSIESSREITHNRVQYRVMYFTLFT